MTAEDSRDLRTIAVSCPLCMAAPGERCTLSNGKTITRWFHSARERVEWEGRKEARDQKILEAIEYYDDNTSAVTLRNKIVAIIEEYARYDREDDE